ncbi:MAG: FkbM family methyltransferase [Paracoccaceae bacterium]
MNRTRLKKRIKGYIERTGYKLVKLDLPSSGDERREWGFIDGFLLGLLTTEKRIPILQCGANDGITHDPIRDFIVSHRDVVTAVLVEPIPDVYDKLAANYADHENITPLNVAVGPHEAIDLYRIKPEYAARYMGITASGITSFNRDYVLRKAKQLLDLDGVPPEDRIERVSQTCHTVSQIIDSHRSRLGDEPFLQIDTEGYDDQVIYTIDFDRHRPIAINYEITHLKSGKSEKLRDYLATKGYRCIRWGETDELAHRMD